MYLPKHWNASFAFIFCVKQDADQPLHVWLELGSRLFASLWPLFQLSAKLPHVVRVEFIPEIHHLYGFTFWVITHILGSRIIEK